MNKWTVRFWGLLALVSLVMLVVTTAWPAPPPGNTDAQLAISALHGFLQSADERRVQQAMAEARVAVIEGAWRSPREVRVAHVPLTRGLTGAGLQALLQPNGMELVTLEAKVPVPGTRNAATVRLGRERLAKFPGSIQQQVDGAMGHERAGMRALSRKFAERPGGEPQSREMREASQSPDFKVYRVEVIGTREGFLRLQEHQWVRAVFVDEDESMVEEVRKGPAYAGAVGDLPIVSATSAPSRRMITNWPVTPNPELALSSTLAFLRVPDEATGIRVLANYHESLRRSAQQDPQALRAADVLLRRGFNASEVEQLLLRHGLDYMSCEIKTPVSDGTAMTMWNFAGGPISLPISGIPIAERVERDIGRWRYRFMHDSTLDIPPDMAQKRREISRSREMGVYRVEAMGTQQSLFELLKEPEVRGVVAETDGVRARAFEEQKARAPAVPIFRARTPLDPEPPGLIVPPPPPGRP